MQIFENLKLDYEKDLRFVHADFFQSLRNGRSLEIDHKWCESHLIQTIKKQFDQYHLEANKLAVIPKIFHFIWLGSNLPEKVIFCINSWQKLHPEFEIRIWSEETLSEILWHNERIKRAFNQASTYAEKADYLRIEILYNYGGIYLDTDVVCLKPINCLLDRGMEFFAGFEMPNSWLKSQIYICNAVMASAPKSAILRRYYDLFESIEDNPKCDPNHRSGPGIISPILEEFVHKGLSQKILLLPCSYFYPTPYEWDLALIHERFEEFQAMIQKETFAVHLWSKSWK